MQAKNDFLVEIHTEELPPKALRRLAESFSQSMQTQLTKAQLEFKDAESYSTPRRLAVLVRGLASQQPDTLVERRGPALAAAYDGAGEPTQALLGFAKSCGVAVDQLQKLQTKQGEWMGFQQQVQGKTVQELLPAFVEAALAQLPIPKRMRWGAGTIEFVRPVKSVMMLYGHDVIDAVILGLRTGRETQGHRFHCKKPLSIPAASAYLKRLEKPGSVIADFERRKQMIREQAEAIATHTFDESARVVIDEALLDEVTGLVEWPVAILGDFDATFLEVPAEALVSAMQDHQRYFPIIDKHGKLLPHFVAISNIEARDMQHVIAGNERVLRARLADAAFFFETDKKQPLSAFVESLKGSVFQAQLGSVYDKAVRLSKLGAIIAKDLGEDATLATQAGLLAKADLATAMVGEFPELQGIAGYYYARSNQVSDNIALAIKEHYLPRFSGDKIPTAKLSAAVALADRLDTLVGIFGINQAPTSEKDPFALRRAALGVLRILIENGFDLDLRELLTATVAGYQCPLPNKTVIDDVLNFILERLKPWYQEQGISPDVFASVAALNITRPFDFHRRIQAVQRFKELPDAESLSVANKRVSNILSKYDSQIEAHAVDARLFETEAERTLAVSLDKLNDTIQPMCQSARYVDVLSQLAELRVPVDAFFDSVMVMAEDKAQRENRLLLLGKLRQLFLRVADIALLQTR
jgi:glycyl-tRNA synthetase beta chain